MAVNQALVFIKPHVVDNTAVVACIRSTFEQRGVRVLSEGDIGAERIVALGMVDKHYAVNALVGTSENPAALPLAKDTLDNFGRLFGISWERACAEGKVFSAVALQRELGNIAAETLIDLWNRAGYTKVGGGLYVAYLKESDRYLLNGFYLSLRDVFTRPGARIRRLTVRFDSETLPWAEFRAGVIGATTPAAARPESIRGHVARNAERYGVSVSSRDNVLHGSASPFEALVEQSIWIEGFDAANDPLGRALSDLGLTMDDMLRLRNENPIVTFDGKSATLIDLCEDRDTPEVCALLSTLASPRRV